MNSVLEFAIEDVRQAVLEEGRQLREHFQEHLRHHLWDIKFGMLVIIVLLAVILWKLW